LESNRVHPRGESAILNALVWGSFPDELLGLRTDSMLDCLELLDTLADPTAPDAMWNGWLDAPPPVFARHPEEGEELGEEDIDDEEDLDEDDFDEEDEDFDDEDFDDEDDDDIDEELDDEIEDIDIDEEEE